MKKHLLSLFLLISSLSYGQVDSTGVVSDTLVLDVVTDTIIEKVKDKILVPGKLNVYQDTYYEAVENIQKRINKENCPKLIKGYRVQVFSCSGGSCKDKADKYYNQFLIAYPDLPVYKMWQPPSLKVRAGNCRTRFEAEAIKKLIEGDFPFVFIVPDFIETPLMLDCDKMDLPKEMEIKE
jgi:hypothetical protein